MNNFAVEAAFSASTGLRRHRFKRVLQRIEDRVADAMDVQRLSLSSSGYLYEREGVTDRQTASQVTEQRSLRVAPGHLVVNPMWLTGGSVAVSQKVGAVSPDYRVFDPHPHLVDPRFLHHLLRSQPYRDQYNLFIRANTTFDRRVQQEDLDQLPIWLPALEEQRRIADFLDDRGTRIDQIIAARRLQVVLLEESALRASYETVRGHEGTSRPSGLEWLGGIPYHWPVLTVSTEFQVDLGKMLDEKRQTGLEVIPYLRNTNVQWDGVDVSDLKYMDVTAGERTRYCVEPGDLLICEGGQPGRSAIWAGGIAPLGYQKALHRARSRGRSRPQWLLECLRVAVSMNVFAVGNSQTTIGHVTNEQLRSLRLPFPSAQEQESALKVLGKARSDIRRLVENLEQSMERLAEYRQSLITASVTGEIDVTTAGSGVSA